MNDNTQPQPLRIFAPIEMRRLAKLGIIVKSEIWDIDELNDIERKCKAVLKASRPKFSERFKSKMVKRNLA